MVNNNKKKMMKAGKITANIFTVLICVVVLFLVVSWLTGRKKGYTSYFKTVYLTVASDSMDGDRSDSFKKNDVIRIRELSEKEKLNLKPGDIITFWDMIGAEEKLNTHRIIEVVPPSPQNYTVQYITQGDNPKYDADAVHRTPDKIVGIYKAKSPAIGRAVVWLQTQNGFLVCAVVPSGIIFVYCMVMVVLNARSYGKIKTVTTKEDVKRQLLEELRQQGLIPPANTDGGEVKKE